MNIETGIVCQAKQQLQWVDTHMITKHKICTQVAPLLVKGQNQWV